MPSVISHDRVSLDFTDQKSRTKQSFIEETDVNTIMGRWRRTGVIEHLAKAEPRYGDFDTADDYLSAMQKVKDADSAFLELPAEVRAAVGNNPQGLLAYLADPANLERSRELGLVEPAPAEADPGPSSPDEGEPTPEG